MIRISGLNKSLYGGGHRVDILNGIDLVIPTGQLVAITGASGSGKTTLLSLIAGLDEPTEGIQPSIIKQIGEVIRYLASTEKIGIILVEQYFDFARKFNPLSVIPFLLKFRY